MSFVLVTLTQFPLDNFPRSLIVPEIRQGDISTPLMDTLTHSLPFNKFRFYNNSIKCYCRNGKYQRRYASRFKHHTCTCTSLVAESQDFLSAFIDPEHCSKSREKGTINREKSDRQHDNGTDQKMAINFKPKFVPKLSQHHIILNILIVIIIIVKFRLRQDVLMILAVIVLILHTIFIVLSIKSLHAVTLFHLHFISAQFIHQFPFFFRSMNETVKHNRDNKISDNFRLQIKTCHFPSA